MKKILIILLIIMFLFCFQTKARADDKSIVSQCYRTCPVEGKTTIRFYDLTPKNSFSQTERYIDQSKLNEMNKQIEDLTQKQGYILVYFSQTGTSYSSNYVFVLVKPKNQQ